MMQEQGKLEANKALVRRWFEEVWNKGRAEAIDEMFAANGIAHGLSGDEGSPLQGPANFKPFHESFRGAFSKNESASRDRIRALISCAKVEKAGTSVGTQWVNEVRTGSGSDRVQAVGATSRLASALLCRRMG